MHGISPCASRRGRRKLNRNWDRYAAGAKEVYLSGIWTRRHWNRSCRIETTDSFNRSGPPSPTDLLKEKNAI